MAQRRARTKSELPLSLPARTYFVTGKGGVGKTTVAAALALAYRDAGVRTLLVEIAGQTSAAALISTRKVAYEPTALSPGLWALNIDPDNALREYARLRLKVRAVSDRLVGNPIFHQFAQAAPGFRELLVLGKLWALSQQLTARRKPQFEAIIVDAPATGHGLGLLGMAGVVARMFPIGPIANEAREIDAFVKDPQRTGVVLVSLPEEMPVNEAIDMHGRLLTQGVEVSSIVLNALLPDRFTQEDCEQLHAARTHADSEPVRAAIDAALYEHERCRDQADERERLEVALGPVNSLPFVYSSQLTHEDVKALSRWLTPRGLRAQRVSVKAARR